jgi:DNA-binding FrmR family transcriptional regulator
MMDYNEQITNRLKRIEGQLRGILRMMEENKDCKDVITQLSAARAAHNWSSSKFQFNRLCSKSR